MSDETASRDPNHYAAKWYGAQCFSQVTDLPRGWARNDVQFRRLNDGRLSIEFDRGEMKGARLYRSLGSLTLAPDDARALAQWLLAA